MRRILALLACLMLALAPTVAEGKKKHKKSKPLGPVTTAIATGATVTAAGAHSTAEAHCPKGLQAVGGGFSEPFGLGGDLVLLSSYRSDPGTWTVDSTPLLGNGPAAATGFAYCRRNTRKLIDSAGTGQLPPSSPAYGSASASCPAGTRLIGGGFQSTSGPGNQDRPVVTTSLSRTPGMWSVSAFNNTDTPQTLTAHAYCMKGIAAPQILSATVTEMTPQFSAPAASTAACSPPPKPKRKKGKRRKKPARLLSGGGFFTPPGPSFVVAVPVYTDARLSGNGWLAAAVNIGSDPGPFSVTSQGFCV